MKYMCAHVSSANGTSTFSYSKAVKTIMQITVFSLRFAPDVAEKCGLLDPSWLVHYHALPPS